MPVFAKYDGVDGESDNTAADSFDFSALESEWQEADLNGDGTVDGSDFNIWNQHRFEPDSDEPGLAGVVIYSDLNYNRESYDTPFDVDFIA